MSVRVKYVVEQLIVATALVVAIFIVAVAMFGRFAHGGELVDCAAKPSSGRWVYRIVDDRRCWFRAGSYRRGQEKPIEELRWSVDIPPISIMSPEPTFPSIEPDVIIPPKAPLSEFEHRWRGIVEGWDHQE